MTPIATYRIQFHKGFPFAEGEKLAAYLHDLGVSHLYASPIMTARPGSNHGYDVVDCTRVNPELGGEDAFRSMARMLREHGVGIILDIVPNHMAVGGADNAMWLDLLEKGRASRYADWFDVDFDTDEPGLAGKVLAPFLGKPYEEALKSDEITLIRRKGDGTFAAAYFHHLFPIRPEDQAAIERQGIETFADPATLHALLERQNYRLAWWRTAGDIINYRRFFDVTELAGIRMENADAFEAVHQKPFELYAEGLIDGVRIDHIDGLTDPTAYCVLLRERLSAVQDRRPGELANQPAYIVVEKILAGDETLPVRWPVDGTTGYDFMNEVSALQHDEGGRAPLDRVWSEVSGRHLSFHDEENAARNQMLCVNFHGQCENLARSLCEIAARQGSSRDLTYGAILRALVSIITHLRVYRSYATGKSGSAGAGGAVEQALALAKAEPAPELAALGFICSVLENKSGDRAIVRAIRKFNNLTAPVAAKAVEDTAFYRYGRLISRNDVGFDAARLAMAAEDFHASMERRVGLLPRSMLATATHDHKRGEDVRGRLAVLSEKPQDWQRSVAHWFKLNAHIRPALADRGDEYQLYQMMVGAWPLDLDANDGDGLAGFRDRLAGWREKSLREAKLRSTWLVPNAAAECAAQDLLSAMLDPGRSGSFLKSLTAFVADIAAAGASNSFVQLALRCLCPGVPDTYQGTEMWDFSLVDPDNRRPVDFDLRRRDLAGARTIIECAATWRDGTVKLRLLQALLQCRTRHPDLFRSGAYVPLNVMGVRSKNVLAFAREKGGKWLVTAVQLHCAEELQRDQLTPRCEWWGDTTIVFPALDRPFESVLGILGRRSDMVPAGEAFEMLPVAVWMTTESPAA
ncbi:MAG: malto-oligosyltrehalose synthase [Beijerinckiaceae bacterium]|nr:malto-oligosyltrehalose synthase [Beijerinckiaceae bacterium]